VAVPAAVLLLCGIVAIFIWVQFGGSLPFQPSMYRITVQLPDATDIYPGSDVQTAGVTIGRVSDVSRVGNGARVTAELAQQYAPLHSGATAVARTKTLLGEGYVEIAPGNPSAPPIPDGGVLPISRVQPIQQLDDVLATFAPSTREDIRRMLGGLATALHGRADALNNALAYVAPTAGNLEIVANTLDHQQSAVRQLIANGGDVLAALGRRQGALQSAVIAGDQVLTDLGQSRRELAATVRALPPFLTALQGASHSLLSVSGDISTAVRALSPVVPLISPALSSIDSAAPTFRAAFDALPSVISAGDRGLPGATALIRSTGSAFTQVYPALRQLIPTLQLLGLLRQSAVALFANVGNLFNPDYVGPGGQLIQGATGVPSVWNEAIAGWVKRLPSNRFNPYPAPNEELQIAHGGLRAYDCRNLKNPNYLPPLGGTPPCLLQGPWTYQGKSAYFPHPVEAPK